MTHQLHEFSELRQKDIFCDAIIRVDDGTEFTVHRLILGACSDYFLALFRNANGTSNTTNTTNNNIKSPPVKVNNRSRPPKNPVQSSSSGNSSISSYEIRGIRGCAMTLALEYIYDAKCGIAASNMLELLLVGDYLGVLGLVRYCEDFIMSAIDVDNCVTLMRFGRHREYQRIYDAAKLFILSDFVHILEARREAMLDLPLDQFQELLRDDRLRVKQEDLVWEACLTWMGHRPQERRQHLVALLMSCRLALTTATFFNERVREHPLVRDSEPCKGIINDVMRLRAGFEDITTIHVSGSVVLGRGGVVA